MKTLHPILIGGTMIGVLVATGCSKSPDHARVDPDRTTREVTESELPGTGAPSDISPATARLRVSDVKVGPVLGADGAVVESVDEVTPGEVLHASVAVGDIGSGSTLKAVWLGPEGQRIAEEVKTVTAGAAFVAFTAPDTAAWSGGDYKVEIYLGDELASSDSFDVVIHAAT